MRFLNVLLALLVSLVCGALVLEGGLRLLDRGPKPTLNRYDASTGWSKRPNAKTRRKTGEFDVTYEINSLGLRDADTSSYEKPNGMYRVLCLGDSFTLGYTVGEHDLFVEQLGEAWNSEGRQVDMVNAGTEGWSTDQEVVWFLTEGVKFRPDLVLLFPYENDLYWNGETQYSRFPKPRFSADGKLDGGALVDPGEVPWWQHTALGLLFKPKAGDPSGVLEVPFEATKFSLSSGKRDEAPVEKRPGHLPREWGALMVDPPDYMVEAVARTKGALAVLRDECAKRGAKLAIVPIPNKAAVQQGAEEALRNAVCLRIELYHVNQAVRTFLQCAQDLGIPAFDPTDTLRAVARTPERSAGSTGDPDLEAPELYYPIDWHFNPRGNLEFARFLHRELGVANLGLPAGDPSKHADFTPERAPSPPARWPYVFAGLWVLLTALYYGNYADEPKWQPPLKVLAMLTAIFAIFLGIGAGMRLVPPAMAPKLVILFVIGVLAFVFWKLGRRLATIGELTLAFVLRGHWYLMPLLVVLLSIGSLLVVAASSPLVAPFIYTLF